MEEARDIVERIEECAKLIKANTANTAVMALILIDAFADIYVLEYLQDKIEDQKQWEEMYCNMKKHCDKEGDDELFATDVYKGIIEKIKAFRLEYDKLLLLSGNFSDRLGVLVQDGILTLDEKNTIGLLHQFRNVHLHQAKQKENYIIPASKLYYNLLNRLFIGMPISSYSSDDLDNKYIKQLSHRTQLHDKECRTELVGLLNREYNIAYSTLDLSVLLGEFLIEKLNEIQEKLEFMLSSYVDSPETIEYIEKTYDVGEIKVSIDKSGKKTYRSTKLVRIENRIYRNKKLTNEHEALVKFYNNYMQLEGIGIQIIKDANDLDWNIWMEVERMMGK